MSAKWPSSVATDADLYIAVNSLQTTLATALGTGDTSVVLASATGFPVAGAVTIDNEVIFYTNISGATLTGCTRGSDGTTAATHSVGVPVGATIIAFHHNGLKDEIEALETWLNTHLGKGATVSSTEFGYLVGVTSAIQTQFGLKAPLASPTFTGTVVVPTPFTVGAVSVTATGTEMNYLVGVTSAIQTQLGLKAPLASPTFTGTAVAATLDAQTLLKGKGTATNDNAAAGYIGEYIESNVTATNFPATGAFGDLTSISLTAGDWEVTGGFFALRAGATVPDMICGISTTSGNSSTGLTPGVNRVDSVGPTASANACAVVPSYRIQLTGTTTVYLKYYADFTVATPTAQGGIRAWRRR